jgi:uncharacterized protein
MQEEPFYSGGLKFECQRCSRCCRHEPGYVFLSKRDLSALRRTTRTDEEDFLELYCRVVHIAGTSRLSLKEKSNYDCIFWEDGECLVYGARPLQCRSYPFWSPFLINRKTWDDLEKDCPGVNRGRLHRRREIDDWLERRWEDPFITTY